MKFYEMYKPTNSTERGLLKAVFDLEVYGCAIDTIFKNRIIKAKYKHRCALTTREITCGEDYNYIAGLLDTGAFFEIRIKL